MARPHWIIYPDRHQQPTVDNARAQYIAECNADGVLALSMSKWLLTHVLESLKEGSNR